MHDISKVYKQQFSLVTNKLIGVGKKQSLNSSSPVTHPTSTQASLTYKMLFMQISIRGGLHCVSRNVPPLVCYNFDTRERILVFLAEMLSIK